MEVKVLDLCDFKQIGIIYEIQMKACITALAFNPKFDWIAIGTEIGWQIWDFKDKYGLIIARSKINSKFSLEFSK